MTVRKKALQVSNPTNFTPTGVEAAQDSCVDLVLISCGASFSVEIRKPPQKKTTSHYPTSRNTTKGLCLKFRYSRGVYDSDSAS